MEEQEPETTRVDDIFLTAVIFEMALGVVALVLGWTLGPDARAMIPKMTWDTIWPIGSALLWGLLAALPMLGFIEIVRRIPCEAVRKLERLGEDGMLQSLLNLRAGEMILISLCAGVGEELLFRGWLMPWLQGLFHSVSSPGMTWFPAIAALVGSSIAFGLFHPLTKLYVVLAAVMGFYFGVLAIGTGNLLIPITAHAAYDATELLLSSRGHRRGAEPNLT